MAMESIGMHHCRPLTKLIQFGNVLKIRIYSVKFEFIVIMSVTKCVSLPKIITITYIMGRII